MDRIDEDPQVDSSLARKLHHAPECLECARLSLHVQSNIAAPAPAARPSQVVAFLAIAKYCASADHRHGERIQHVEMVSKAVAIVVGNPSGDSGQLRLETLVADSQNRIRKRLRPQEEVDVMEKGAQTTVIRRQHQSPLVEVDDLGAKDDRLAVGVEHQEVEAEQDPFETRRRMHCMSQGQVQLVQAGSGQCHVVDRSGHIAQRRMRRIDPDLGSRRAENHCRRLQSTHHPGLRQPRLICEIPTCFR